MTDQCPFCRAEIAKDVYRCGTTLSGKTRGWKCYEAQLAQQVEVVREVMRSINNSLNSLPCEHGGYCLDEEVVRCLIPKMRQIVEATT
jgi:hypothetical protein